MTLRASCLALLLSILPMAGCGTVANLAKPGPVEGGKTPFGGVRYDLSCIQNASNGDSDSKTGPMPDSEEHQTAHMLLWAVDLPFTCIGDVITWPYTASYTFINTPVPVPPIMQATASGPVQIPLPTLPAPESKEPDKKTPDKKTPDKDSGKDKPRDEKPDALPMPLPKPMTSPPPVTPPPPG
jgi:uncharacterized protein YceK